MSKRLDEKLTSSLKGNFLKIENEYLKINSFYIGYPGNVSVNGENYSYSGEYKGKTIGGPLSNFPLVFEESELPWNKSSQLELDF